MQTINAHESETKKAARLRRVLSLLLQRLVCPSCFARQNVTLPSGTRSAEAHFKGESVSVPEFECECVRASYLKLKATLNECCATSPRVTQFKFVAAFVVKMYAVFRHATLTSGECFSETKITRRSPPAKELSFSDSDTAFFGAKKKRRTANYAAQRVSDCVMRFHVMIPSDKIRTCM